MTKLKALPAVLAALLLSGEGTFAQMNHGTHGTSPSTPTGQAAPSLANLTGRAFDRAYLSMMIAHHRGAIDMSRAVVEKLRDSRVRKWANAVIADQTKEINAMTSWLRGMGGVQENVRDAMTSEMTAMIAPLKTARNRDEAFVRAMLPHHASALDMANLALQKSNEPRVLKLSRDIVKAQADEMYAFRLWLAAR